MTPRDIRQALLDAVEEIVTEKGSRDLSLREVARRAGVSHAAPGHHFGDKEGMLAAFAERGFEKFGQMMSATEAGMLDGIAYVSFAREHQAYFDVMFRSGLDKSKHPGLDSTSSAAYDSLVQGVKHMQQAGVFPEVPAEILTLRVWSVVHGLASLLIDDQLDLEEDEVDQVIASVLALDEGPVGHAQA